MSLSSGPNLGLLENGAFGEQHYAELMRLWRGIDGLVQPTVKSATTVAPPASPGNGDRYLIPVSATGAWAGRTGQIARWTAMLATAGWEFYIPRKGWEIAIEDQTSASGLPQMLSYTGSMWLQQLQKAVGAFSAYASIASTPMPAATFVKAPLNTVTFDTSGWFDATNNRFTPKLAGVYELNARGSANVGTGGNRLITMVYKNGVLQETVNDIAAAANADHRSSGSCLVIANGTTDYFELWMYSNATSTMRGSITDTVLSGFLVGLS